MTRSTWACFGTQTGRPFKKGGKLGLQNVQNQLIEFELLLTTAYPVWTLSLLDRKKYDIEVVGKNINPNIDTQHVFLKGKGVRFVESLELLERMV